MVAGRFARFLRDALHVPPPLLYTVKFITNNLILMQLLAELLLLTLLFCRSLYYCFIYITWLTQICTYCGLGNFAFFFDLNLCTIITSVFSVFITAMRRETRIIKINIKSLQ